MTSGRALAIFPAVPATLSVSYRPPDIFPFPFSPAVSTCTILAFNRDLSPLPSPPLHSALCVCFCCPCHLIFSHPPHTRPPTKRHQSHHPIPSQIFRSPHISLRIWPSPPHLVLPHLPLPLSSSVFPALPTRHVLPVVCHASCQSSQL